MLRGDCVGDLRGASKGFQQAVQRLIADDIAGADVPRFDGNIAEALMGPFGVLVPQISNDRLAQMILREERDLFSIHPGSIG